MKCCAWDWRRQAAALAVYLVWLNVLSAGLAATLAVPRSVPPGSISVAKRTAKLPCCCRPGHCHMAMCHGNPNFLRAQTSCAACVCRLAPPPRALLPDSHQRRLNFPAAIITAIALLLPCSQRPILPSRMSPCEPVLRLFPSRRHVSAEKHISFRSILLRGRFLSIYRVLSVLLPVCKLGVSGNALKNRYFPGNSQNITR